MVTAVLAGIWASGYIPVFAANRGLLQLVVVVPLTSFAVASALTHFRILTVREVCWTVLPVEALILLGTGLSDPGFTAWPWAIVVSCVTSIPWIVGGLLVSRLRRPDGRRDR